MRLLDRLTRWLRRNALTTLLPSRGMVDLNPRRGRTPSPTDLLGELKSTAWTCASINAGVCASLPPRLFLTVDRGGPSRHPTRKLDSATLTRLNLPHTPFTAPGSQVEEVVDHPLLSLLRQVNPTHNSFDLWELTQLSLEVHGSAYWLLDHDPVLDLPRAIWILPTHLVTPRREPNSPRLVDAYEVRGQAVQRFTPEQVVHFRYPDPRDPYTSGLSPLKACFDQATLVSDFAALKRSVYENAALPSVLITSADGLGPEERQRLEHEWQRKLKGGGQGSAIVADADMKVTVLSHSMGDLAALADLKASKEDIANAFHVPLPFLSGDTNLANMQAADHLHKSLAILPRLRRRDEKLNEQLLPRFDPAGRVFFATPDPTPANQAFLLAQEQADLKRGVRTINEVRAARGLGPSQGADASRFR